MRLTKKIFTDLYASPCDEDTEEKQAEQQWKICNKLGQLEDIEEYIERGIWYAFGGNITYFNHIVSDMKQIGIVFDRGIMWLDFKDCGKTWALTKEELL